MTRLSLRAWLIGGALCAVCAMVTVAVSAGLIKASQLSACGTDGSVCQFTGGFSAISMNDAAVPPGSRAVSAPNTASFGALIYDDYKLVEAQARAKLQRGLKVRQTLSPYDSSPDFTQFVQKLDYQAGWTQDYTGSTPYTEVLTVTGLINKADQDLRDARNLYAFLAVYAPVPRFRSDTYYTTTASVNYNGLKLCGFTSQEQPDPSADPPTSGLVLDPVIDWCDFPARLRQSVREAAQLRMIFGQEFMADALGGYFSGQFSGGDFLARQEEAKLQAAQYQYDLAEKGLAEALKISVGSGCFVSDFFQEPEWSLLSRIAESRETAQHEIAVRQSYLDIAGPVNGAATPKALAQNTLRQASTDGYIKLIGFAGLGDAAPTGAGCAKGTRPDGKDVAEMTLNMLNTRRKAHEMAAGRNIFGFDVSFTPDAPFKSTVPSTCDSQGSATGNHGLWDDAQCAAIRAQTLEQNAIAAGRDFDNSQAALRTAVKDIQTNIDASITANSGCTWNAQSGDQVFYDCVSHHVALLKTCLRVVTSTVLIGGEFDTCMGAPNFPTIDNKKAAWHSLMDLRGVFIDFQSILTKAVNIDTRVQLAKDHNAIVTDWLLASGLASTAADVANAGLSAVSCMATELSPEAAVKDTACVAASTLDLIAVGTAGALSTKASIKTANADTDLDVQNMLLDQSELVIDAYHAHTDWLSNKAEFEGLLDDMGGDVIEAQKQRAYYAHSPANDPSFRIMRDSARLQLARQMDKASRFAYLTARRAEYEYAARLYASGFRISDIYRARTAQDILDYMSNLAGVTSALAGSQGYHTTADDRTISVARDYLNLSNAALLKEGIPSSALTATRTSRFRAWVSANTIPNTFESPYDGKPALKFNLVTSVISGGLWSRVILQGYDRYWLMKTAGIADPKPTSNGMSVNVVTDQGGMSYRTAGITQGGLVHMRAASGCTFDYRLMAPAVLLGLEYASNQPADQRTAVFSANVNGTHLYSENGFRTESFDGQAISTTDWEMVLFSSAPDSNLTDMNLQQLTDIELRISFTYASRTPGPPQLSECTRIDN